MEKYERKIKINRIISTVDNDNDGIEESIVFLNKEDLFLPIILKQTIKDLGVYTDYKEKPEIIDLGNFWSTSNNGYNDGGTNPIVSGLTNPYANDGSEIIVGNTGTQVNGCTDPNAINYNPQATVDNGSCDYGVDIPDVETGPTSGGISTNIGGGCFRLSTGWVSLDSINDTYTVSYMTQKASEWCRAIHPSCGNSYPILNNCTPNGCPSGSGTCCPGPIDTYHLLTANECQDSGANCSGSDCNCNGSSQSLFGGIKYATQSRTINNNTEYNRSWSFYCIPN